MRRRARRPDGRRQQPRPRGQLHRRSWRTANWAFTGGTNYNDESDSVAIAIGKADADCSSIVGYSGTFDAAAHGASGSCAGVPGDPTAVGSSLDLGDSFTDAPGGTANWAFTGGTDYNDQSDSVAIAIGKADADCSSIVGYSGTFDAAAHGASGSCAGVPGDPTAVGSSLDLGDSFTDAPGGTANWAFTGGTNSTTRATRSRSPSARPTPTAARSSATRPRRPPAGALWAGGRRRRPSAAASTSGSFTDAPGKEANWAFTGGTNYNDQSDSVAIA